MLCTFLQHVEFWPVTLIIPTQARISGALSLARILHFLQVSTSGTITVHLALPFGSRLRIRFSDLLVSCKIFHLQNILCCRVCVCVLWKDTDTSMHSVSCLIPASNTVRIIAWVGKKDRKKDVCVCVCVYVCVCVCA
jgi:hypothetical protein